MRLDDSEGYIGQTQTSRSWNMYKLANKINRTTRGLSGDVDALCLDKLHYALQSGNESQLLRDK